MMRMRWFAWTGLVAALSLAPLVAGATPAQFVFTTFVLGTTDIPGVSTGETVTLTVVADNGNSTLISQTWLPSDVQSVALSVGTYSASYPAPRTDPFSSTAHVLSTSAAGDVVDAEIADIDGINTDVFGSSTNVSLFTNAVQDFEGRMARFQHASTINPGRWTVTQIPEPSTLALVSLGLVVIAVAERGRRA